MDKIPAQEVADEIGVGFKLLSSKAIQLGIKLKNASATLSPEQAEEIANFIATGKSDLLQKQVTQAPKKVAKKTPTQDVKDEITFKRSATPVVDKKTIEQDKKSTNATDTKEQKKKKTKSNKSKATTKKTKSSSENSEIIEFSQSALIARVSQDSLLGDEVILFDDNDLLQTSKFVEEPKIAKKPNSPLPVNHFRAGKNKGGLGRVKRRKKRFTQDVQNEIVSEINIPENIRVYEFADKCKKGIAEVIKVLFELGMIVSKNDFLKKDEIEILCEEFNVKANVVDELEGFDYVKDYEDAQDESLFEERASVVSIMGHVDHGKTTLLDKIRNRAKPTREAGGITQKLSCFCVTHNNKGITFIDTPGHAAFSFMRESSTKVTDIAIIVVACDDGVKPQTIEALKQAQKVGANIIIAVNKMDKEGANSDLVKAGLAEHGITPVDWGGEHEFVEISALTGKGIDELLETILLQAEVMELKANPKGYGKACIVEATILKGKGVCANVIVQNGVLNVGDNILAHDCFGKIKSITNDSGENVKTLKPSEVGSIIGFSEVPKVGSILLSMKDANKTKEIANEIKQYNRSRVLNKSIKVSLDEMSELVAQGKIKNLPIIIKADTSGSLEAIKGALESIKNDEVQVSIIHSGVGGITKTDLDMSNNDETCIILGFNVRPTGDVKRDAKVKGISINTYDIVYELIDDVKALVSGMMKKVIKEENTGQANVKDTFVIPKVGTVAGCIVSDGKVVRGGKARLIRDGVVVYTGTISSLKRFQDDVKEVGNGMECGIMFDGYNDIKVDDYIETFIEHEQEVKV